jgi:hypothetical protein
MDRMSRIFTLSALIFLGITCQAQESQVKNAEGKNTLSFNGMRFSSALSIGYGYRLWQNNANTFRTGLQTGIGFGPKAWEPFSQLILPFGIYAEYGQKHRIGIDANIIYQIKTRIERGISPNGWTDYRVIYDNGAFTSSLYYSYNFGLNMRYAAGIGGNFISYFGSNYGYTVNYPDQIAPFIFFNVRF